MSVGTHILKLSTVMKMKANKKQARPHYFGKGTRAFCQVCDRPFSRLWIHSTFYICAECLDYPLPLANGWRPMSEAPKDGTTFLATTGSRVWDAAWYAWQEVWVTDRSTVIHEDLVGWQPFPDPQV